MTTAATLAHTARPPWAAQHGEGYRVFPRGDHGLHMYMHLSDADCFVLKIGSPTMTTLDALERAGATRSGPGRVIGHESLRVGVHRIVGLREIPEDANWAIFFPAPARARSAAHQGETGHRP